jgi:hypothetical protein
MIEVILWSTLGLLALYIFAKWIKEETENNIPGPKGSPLIGCAKEVRADNMHLKFMEYAEIFGEIVQLKILVNNFIVLNSESLLRKAFADNVYKPYFNDRPDIFFGHHFRCGNKSLGMTSDGAGEDHKIARKEIAKAIHAYGSGLQDLEDNVMVEMELLIKRIDNMQGKEFECLDLFGRSLSNTMSLIVSTS